MQSIKGRVHGRRRADTAAVGDKVEAILDNAEAVGDATVPAARQITYLNPITHSIDLN